VTVPTRASHTVTVDRAALTFRMERVFAASPEAVWRALSSCEAISKWWAPLPWIVSSCAMDFRVGGTWLYCMQGPDGTEAWGTQTFEEIDEPVRIVAVDSFADASGTIDPTLPTQRFRYDLVPVEGGTRLVNTAFYERVEDLETVLRMGMEQGATMAWDQLEGVIAAG
jgi:uncharacterized protein YndB with AHSA1/START domain